MKKEIICIVDDDKVYQFTATRAIKSVAAVKRILVFNDGEEANIFLKDNMKNREILPDIIFLDINMPYMDGWQFMEEFVKLKPSLSKVITIYMVSSSVQPSDVERAKKISDISDYIVKPINKETFQELLNG